MQTQNQAIVYLPLTRRAGLVRAFAALVRALPTQPQVPAAPPVPDHLRRDLGLPPAPPGHGARPPPRWTAF